MKCAHVIGAGLSGLASAWHLADRGFSVTVFEAAAAPGGLIRTHRTEHGIVETAANAFVRDARVDAWLSRLELASVSPRRESKRRYIFRERKPRRWPLTVGESIVLTTRLTRAAITRGFAARPGESMAAWGTRVLGPGATEYLLQPAMQGIYAAPARDLSAAVIFNGRSRGRREMVAPVDGMGAFPTRLHQRLVARGVRFEFNSVMTAVDARVPTVIATDAATASMLIGAVSPALASLIGRIRVSPLITVTAFFEPDEHDTHGFGVLFPAGCGISSMGVLFNADIFDSRSQLRSETWIVGDRGRSLTSKNDDELQAMLRVDRRALCGRSQTPLSIHISRWPRAIPVYDGGVAELQRHLNTLPPNLALAGNYLGTIGVSSLLAVAERAAARLG